MYPNKRTKVCNDCDCFTSDERELIVNCLVSSVDFLDRFDSNNDNYLQCIELYKKVTKNQGICFTDKELEIIFHCSLASLDFLYSFDSTSEMYRQCEKLDLKLLKLIYSRTQNADYAPPY